MQQKLYLFLGAHQPQESLSQLSNYEFDRDEIIQVCKSALHLIKEDEFFESIAINFAQFIY